jgi:S1-C subfamily serine protease
MRHVRSVALLVALSTGATVSCGNGSGVDDTIAEATVRVRADGCGPRTELGTATSIGDGLVVTAAHVVAGAERVEVVDRRGDPVEAEVVLFDPALDVAALRPITAPGPPVPLRADRAIEGDTGVIAIASTDGSIELVDVEVMQRVTILTTDIYRDEEVQRPGLRVAVSVEPGDSGAMVHVEGGGVGIVWSRSIESSDQAWTVDLPDELLEPASRRTLVEPVDTGPCP